jgi:hypothetical protein
MTRCLEPGSRLIRGPTLVAQMLLALVMLASGAARGEPYLV